jgi:hypothetical protein
VIGRAAVQTALMVSPDAPQLHIVSTALYQDAVARDWVSVSSDFELLLEALGIALTPEDRTALCSALITRLETAPLAQPGPPAPGQLA